MRYYTAFAISFVAALALLTLGCATPKPERKDATVTLTTLYANGGGPQVRPRPILPPETPPPAPLPTPK